MGVHLEPLGKGSVREGYDVYDHVNRRRQQGKMSKSWGRRLNQRGLGPGASEERVAGQKSPGLVSDILLPWGPLLSNGKDLPGK